MGVQHTKSGGIYIEISGDYSKLRDDLKAVSDLSKTAGADISKALGNAIDPKRASSSISSLTQSLMKAQAAGKALSVDFSSQEKALREWGQMVGMAGKSLDNYVAIQSKAFKTQSVRAFTSELKNLQRLTGASDEEMNQLAKSLGGVGNEFSKASRSSRDLCLNMTKLYLEAVKVAAAKFAWEWVKGSFELAARYETLGVVVQQVGKVAGYSAIEIDKNVNALRRMGIAGIEARQTLTKLMQAQVDISKTPGLARIAQDAAVIDGSNSSEAFEKLVQGIQSANTQILRNMGINVNFEQSYSKLAASLGKTTDELTEQEKVQARLNAVMEAGEKITGTYEAAMTTLGKQTSSLSRIHQDFATDFGKFLTDVANASGGVKGYTAVLEGWNAIILTLRGSMAGLSFDEMTKAFRSGGLQGGRELAENMEAARLEFEQFKIQAAAFSAQGIDVEPYVKEVAKVKDEFIGVRDEIDRLESLIGIFESEGLDTSAMVSQLEALKNKFIDGATGAQLLRRSIQEALAMLRFDASSVKVDAPATLFTFKPYVPGSGIDADIREIDKTLADLRAAYGKTSDAVRQGKLRIIKENQELVAALVAQGHMTKAEADKLNSAFAKEIESLTKGTRTAALSTERTSYQAAEAARSASDSLKNLRLRYSELVAQIECDSLGAALARSQRDYETQLDAIAKREAEIAKNRAIWAKEGKLTGETLSSLDEQQRYLDQEREIIKTIREANDELARRADLGRTYRANMDYKGLIGDLRAYYAEEVNLLELQMQSASEAEKRALAEKRRIAEARASMNVGGMFQTGMQNMARDAQQRMIDFWEKGLPESIGAASDSFASFFADVGMGTKSMDKAWQDLGQSFNRIISGMIQDLISATFRMAIFGQTSQQAGASGGGFGGLFGAISNMFGGGNTVTFAGTTYGSDIGSAVNASLFGSAKGNVFSAPALSAYSSSIVSKPTVFPFAKGIGLMGEAGAEAIMPLRRNSRGQLGVEASGTGGGQQAAPQVNVNVITPPGAKAETQQQKNQNGGWDISVFIDQVDASMASGIMSGRSKTADAMRKVGQR